MNRICSAWIKRGCSHVRAGQQNFRALSGGGHHHHLEPTTTSADSTPVRPWDQELSIALHSLVWEFRRSGHVFADLDPLKFINRPERAVQQETISPILATILKNQNVDNELPSALEYLMANPDEKVFLGSVLPSSDMPWWSFNQVVDFCKQAWCGPLSIEVAHLASQTHQEWWVSQLEQVMVDSGPTFTDIHPLEIVDSETRRLETLKLLLQTHQLENVLQNKFPGAKRFGLEGAESLIPLLHSILQNAALGGNTKHVEFGMGHRGRLNVLCTILNKPVEKVLAEFIASREDQKHLDMGDVKYPSGTTFHQTYIDPGTSKEHQLRLNLSADPSHLEAVDPVTMGRVRTHLDANPQDSPLEIIIHGDAAVSGQGVVSETLQLSELDSCRVSGRIHVVLNNQEVGFTTSSRTARSSLHCTDIFKSASSIPIIHVNGDHPDLVRWAGTMAEKYRSTFGQSVAIDLICYPRRGHNELDDPPQAHPLLYEAIEKHPFVKDIYAKKLLEHGVLRNEIEWRELEEEERQRFDTAADHVLNHHGAHLG